jgi:hypothetical protein
LRRIARRHLRGERAGHKLETTELINVAYLKLVEQSVSWQNRAHFFGIAARLMRQLLVDYARARQEIEVTSSTCRICASIIQSASADQPDDRLFPPTRRQVSFCHS